MSQTIQFISPLPQTAWFNYLWLEVKFYRKGEQVDAFPSYGATADHDCLIVTYGKTTSGDGSLMRVDHIGSSLSSSFIPKVEVNECSAIAAPYYYSLSNGRFIEDRYSRGENDFDWVLNAIRNNVSDKWADGRDAKVTYWLGEKPRLRTLNLHDVVPVSAAIWPALVMRFNECKKKNYLRVKRGYIGAYHECAWPFPNREETRTRHQYDTDDISPAHRAAYELKRWLHGFKSIYDTKKEVAKQAVRRRIIKNKVTKSDLDFFKTIYGVSQVGRWIKEAQNKQKHEHTSN